ncbi:MULTISPECIES: porin [unclassified Caballeronia]|uniref:porin n=1 Tax=unclassified Caballeronia TaxID=2646786 RepID=UPI00285D53E8|nr:MULTISPECIES: porin [unclassified Caballeronia]MDR5741161.1 porin [Caballeronia sp. LZ016]MDR5807061.1 porin [Caballeronia sp. LZ019]
MPMNRKAISCAAFLAACGIGQAHAASVTLYGLIDYGVNYQSNSGGGRVIGGSSGIMQGSRWGFKANEDLGGGLAAIFQLENGFDAGNGRSLQGGAQFGRQAWLGLSSNAYGTVTLGRQYDSLVTFVETRMNSSNYGGGTTAHPGDLDNLNNSKRVNNSIKYMSPSLGGFTFGGVYGFGGQAGDFSRNRIWSTGIGYDYGNFSAGVAYMNVRNPNQSFFTATPTNVSGTNLNNMTASPVYSGYASARTYQAIAAAGRYTIGPATIGLVYSNVQFKNLGDTSSGSNPLRLSGTAKFDTAEVNATYYWTPALLSELVYSYTRGSGVGSIGSSHYNNVSLSLDYYLSKRTDVYIISSTQFADGTDSTGRPAHATLNALTASSSDRQTFVQLGIRHKF